MAKKDPEAFLRASSHGFKAAEFLIERARNRDKTIMQDAVEAINPADGEEPSFSVEQSAPAER